MLQGLLSEAGIPSVLKRSFGFDNPDFLASGPRDVMVNAAAAQRAREVLAETMIEDEARRARGAGRADAASPAAKPAAPRRRGSPSGSPRAAGASALSGSLYQAT